MHIANPRACKADDMPFQLDRRRLCGGMSNDGILWRRLLALVSSKQRHVSASHAQAWLPSIDDVAEPMFELDRFHDRLGRIPMPRRRRLGSDLLGSAHIPRMAVSLAWCRVRQRALDRSASRCGQCGIATAVEIENGMGPYPLCWL